jgi:hypothetical protein
LQSLSKECKELKLQLATLAEENTVLKTAREKLVDTVEVMSKLGDTFSLNAQSHAATTSLSGSRDASTQTTRSSLATNTPSPSWTQAGPTAANDENNPSAQPKSSSESATELLTTSHYISNNSFSGLTASVPSTIEVGPTAQKKMKISRTNSE